MSYIALMNARNEAATKQRDTRGRVLSPREQLMERIRERRGAH